MTNRNIAMQWWSVLTIAEKDKYCSLYYINRESNMLTGREIEFIYLDLNHMIS